MSSSVVQLQFIPRRMLTKTEAAYHCGMPAKSFGSQCHVSPVKLPNGQLRYDVRDLDAWLDSLKTGTATNADDIVAKLK